MRTWVLFQAEKVQVDLLADVSIELAKVPLSGGRDFNAVGQALVPQFSHEFTEQSSTGTNLKEVEANQFAACLLMPAALVRASIQELGTEDLYDGHITLLAEKFKVSEQAMTIRLTVLGLLS